MIDKCYIYILTSPSGKKYVGQTTSIKKRFENYRNLRRLTQIKLSAAILKYGWDNFIKEEIEFINITQEELDGLEIEYIKKYDSFNNGYNCTIGGSGKRIHNTEEERLIARKISQEKHRELHLDKIREAKRKYSRSVRGKLKQKECYTDNYLKNKDIIASRNKQYILDNKEKHLERRRKYYLKNKEKENARCREFYWKKKLELQNDK